MAGSEIINVLEISQLPLVETVTLYEPAPKALILVLFKEPGISVPFIAFVHFI